MTTEITVHRKNSSLAIISLISGLLGITFLPLLGSIIAVITAPLAKKEIIESNGQLTGQEMAKVGQILGWIGIVLFGCLSCCCIAFLIIPLLAAFGIVIDSGSYYWIVPELVTIF